MNIGRQRCSELKIKVSANEIKEKGVTRLCSVNYNRFGPGSEGKTDQLVREGKKGHRWSYY